MLIWTFLFSLRLILFGVAADSNFDPLKHLSGTSLPFDSDSISSPLDPVPPQGCKVSRVSYLVRHAAIHSNEFEFREIIEPFVDKLKKSNVNWSASPNLAFLSAWESPILSKEREKLSRSGKLQAMNFGVELAYRYFHLRTPRKVWSASSDRTMISAEYFTKGLAIDASEVSLIGVPENKNQGLNSLTPYLSCPVYNKTIGTNESSVRKPLNHSKSNASLTS